MIHFDLVFFAADELAVKAMVLVIAEILHILAQMISD